MRLYEELAKTGLEDLKMTTALGTLDTASQEAAAGGWSYTHFLGYLLDGELKERRRLRVKMSLQFARFPYLKRIEDFDFSVQPSVDRRLIEELNTLRFVDEGRNIVLLGPPGVGKTHLAIGLGWLWPKTAGGSTLLPPLILRQSLRKRCTKTGFRAL